MGIVDAEDFLGDGGEEAAFVVQVKPGVLSCRPPFDTNKLFLLVFCPDERECFIA